MPIAPHPYTMECPDRHWSKTVAPSSDVLMPNDMPYRCPKCGKGLIRKQASFLATQIALLKRQFLL